MIGLGDTDRGIPLRSPTQESKRRLIPSSIAAEAFDISVSKVNWLSNVTNVVFIVSCFGVPWAVGKWGIKLSVRSHPNPKFEIHTYSTCSPLPSIQCIFSAAVLVLAAWLRFAGIAHSLSPNGAYALLIVSQVELASHPISSCSTTAHHSSCSLSSSQESVNRFSKP